MWLNISTIVIIVCGVNCLNDRDDFKNAKIMELVEKLNQKLDITEKNNILLEERNQKLENRLGMIEKNNILLEEKNQNLQTRLDILEKKNIVLEEKNQRLEKQLGKLQTKVKSLEETNKMGEKRQDKLQKKVKTNNIMEKRQVQEVVQPVAFTVSLIQAKQVLGQHQTIEYDNVITNLGNGYDARHGHFTAPVKGLYLFSVTLMSSYGSNPNYLYAELVKNGATIVPLYAANDDSDSTSATILITLNANDMVWVRTNTLSTQTVHGSGYDIFSGLLISQLQ